MLHLVPMQRLIPALLPLALALLFGGCTTPQIPLPPPGTADFTLQVDKQAGTIKLQGKVDLSGGWIEVRDPKGNRLNWIVQGDGSFETYFFPIEDGAKLEFRLFDGDNRSDPVCSSVRYDPPALVDSPC